MTKKTYKDVSEYYDKLWADLEKQHIAGINSRHRVILRNLKKIGLRSSSKILEIGCGIGSLTRHIATSIPGGKILGVDISPETIEYARNKYKGQSNMEFQVSDMTSFSNSSKFDFIVLPDVLEHIPISAHDNLFKILSRLIHPTSAVLINIPNPRALEWFHENQPEVLQILDQPIHTDQLLATVYKYGFFIESLETYSLYYVEPEYQSIVLRPKSDFVRMTPKSKITVLLNNIKLRLLS